MEGCDLFGLVRDLNRCVVRSGEDVRAFLMPARAPGYCSYGFDTPDLREYAARGYIDKAPCYNSVFNALENPDLTPILRALVEESARPVRDIETDFAVDSTGFSSSVYRRWFDAKYGRVHSMSEYVKAHAMVGVKTNVVTSVEVTPGNINDYHLLAPLLASTARRFDVARLSADKGYSRAEQRRCDQRVRRRAARRVQAQREGWAAGTVARFVRLV